MTLLVCSANEGALAVAEELTAEATRGKSGAVSVADAEPLLELAWTPSVSGPTVLLLYLTQAAFLDAGGTVAATVKRALELKIPIAMAHEQDPARGGCPFQVFIEQAPKELQLPPYRLFDTIAVPLYPSAEHRVVSLRHVLRSVGAKSVKSIGMAIRHSFSHDLPMAVALTEGSAGELRGWAWLQAYVRTHGWGQADDENAAALANIRSRFSHNLKNFKKDPVVESADV